MKPFNLLPEHIINKQHRRQGLVRLSVTQAVILVLVLCSFPLLHLISINVTRRSEILTRLISDSRYAEPDLLAEKIAGLDYFLATRDAVLSSYSLEFPNSEWLEMANTTIPSGVMLTGFEFAGERLSLYCQTDDLNLEEEHRQNLINAGLTAELGTIVSDGGAYSYVLHLSVTE